MTTINPPARTTHIAAIRRFNRFYTQRIRLLAPTPPPLGSALSLAEPRALFEISHRASSSGAELAWVLDLDPGYISRVLARMQGRDVLIRRPSPTDKRLREYSLSHVGQQTWMPWCRPVKSRFVRCWTSFRRQRNTSWCTPSAPYNASSVTIREQGIRLCSESPSLATWARSFNDMRSFTKASTAGTRVSKRCVRASPQSSLRTSMQAVNVDGLRSLESSAWVGHCWSMSTPTARRFASCCSNPRQRPGASLDPGVHAFCESTKASRCGRTITCMLRGTCMPPKALNSSAAKRIVALATT
jgi:DNA-binding MarR family transcriptional regulator